ncbi:MAG TPA: hypothetical protein VIG99_17340 [Myxococcaceae bacterium]|jgi:hypothetical protein
MSPHRRPDTSEAPQVCRICGSPAVARGLCRRCYARARRGAPPLSEYGRARNGDGTQITFRLERYLRHLVTMLAQQEGVQDAEWLRRAVTERADRQLEHLSAAARPKA